MLARCLDVSQCVLKLMNRWRGLPLPFGATVADVPRERGRIIQRDLAAAFAQSVCLQVSSSDDTYNDSKHNRFFVFVCLNWIFVSCARSVHVAGLGWRQAAPRCVLPQVVGRLARTLPHERLQCRRVRHCAWEASVAGWPQDAVADQARTGAVWRQKTSTTIVCNIVYLFFWK